jgi:hypothetical protein
MRTAIGLFLLIPLLGILSCKKTSDGDKPSSTTDSIIKSSKIKYTVVNKQYVFTRDLKSIPIHTDEVSVHLDSIISGKIIAQFVSTGTKAFDLDSDKVNDVSFEIIDLQPFNNHNLPASFDSLAVRVNPLTIQVLDNSTWGYADALNLNEVISSKGNWSNKTCVLGTFQNSGQFNGRGEKYLGIRFVKDKAYFYGWIKLYCSQHNDTLRIIDFAIHQLADTEIKTGQKE